MDDLPAAVFEAEDRRTSQRDRRRLFAAPHFRLEPLELVNACELGRDVLRKPIKTQRSAVPVIRCRSRHRLGHLRPTSLSWAEGIGQRNVLALGEQRLKRRRVPFGKRVDRAMRFLDDGLEVALLIHAPNITQSVDSDEPGSVISVRSRRARPGLPVAGQELNLRPPGYEPPQLCKCMPPCSAETSAPSQFSATTVHLGGTRSHCCGSPLLAERLQFESLRQSACEAAWHLLRYRGPGVEPQIDQLRYRLVL
jgi:hypothetical protein